MNTTSKKSLGSDVVSALLISSDSGTNSGDLDWSDIGRTGRVIYLQCQDEGCNR